MNKILKIYLATLCLISTSLNAESDDVLLENSWMNVGYSNAKDAMLSGATTATAKGHSSLFSNPAGLATNYAWGAYIKGSVINHQNSTGTDNNLATTKEVLPNETAVSGIFYKSLVLEANSAHIAVGLGYGYESRFGLFSLGANYLWDQTNEENYLTLATGDYYTAGFQWQKTFVDSSDFYAVYFGASMKGQGVKEFTDEQIVRISPVVQKIGLGLETNLGTTTLLLTYDLSRESWNHIDDQLNTQAYGLKLMLLNGLSFGAGMSQGGYITDVDLKDSSTYSAGLEFSLWKVNAAVAYLAKEITNSAGDVYIKEDMALADISIAF